MPFSQRAMESAAVSLRLVFGKSFEALSESDARNVCDDYLLALNDDHCTVVEYRRRLGGAENLQSYAAAIRGNYENR